MVLIGGESRRMGKDKASIKFLGTPLLEHVLKVVSPLFTKIFISARDKNYAYSDDDSQVKIITDNYQGRGPLIGLESALSASEDEWVFLLSCDLPFLSGQIIRYLAELRDTKQGLSSDCILPITDGRPQPTMALYRKTCHKELQKILKTNETFGLISFLRSSQSLKTLEVKEEELKKIEPSLRSFTDIDTPEELKNTEKIMRGLQRKNEDS